MYYKFILISECNVSKTTVSRVLNNHPYVSKEKRDMILKAINDLDYTPNYLARNFRRNKTQTIALSVPSIDHPFFAQLIKGVSHEALFKNYKVIVFQTFYDKQTELELLELLKHKEVDGIILGTLENEWDQISPFLKYGPILLCNEYHHSADITIIGYDEFEATYMGVVHLIERGHKKIGFCFDTPYSEAQCQRKEGYLKALQDYDLHHRSEWIFGEMFNIEDGFRVFHKIKDLKDRPSAIFTGNDQVAAGIIKQAMKNGFKVPEDLAVIGFDNQLICQVVTPTITTIDIPVIELGQQAVLKIIESISGNASLNRRIIKLPTKLIIREST
ncbi:NTD biosynthesis operon transcriptional regulator NtdR [Bacillus subtilis]|uniref:NTD biosynthesis operon transcriptional regulator NtdR n=1 Tax=Bacillus subtilis TaxID=1423 RepID=UPI00387330B4